MLCDTTARGEIPVRDSITATSLLEFGDIPTCFRKRMSFLHAECMAFGRQNNACADSAAGASGIMMA
jgi:hypothetical protein